MRFQQQQPCLAGESAAHFAFFCRPNLEKCSFAVGILGRGDIAVVTASQAVLGIALGALFVPFYTALSIAILGDLKVRKEGTDLEQRIAASA